MTDSPPFWGSIIAVALVSGLTGFYASQLLSIKSSLTASSSDSKDVSESDATDPSPITSQDLPGPSRAAPLSTSQGTYRSAATDSEEHKLVLVVRTDLGMTKGKIAAQCGHATLACYKQALESTLPPPPPPQSPSSSSSSSRSSPGALDRWERSGQAKIALKVTSEEDMLLLHATALSLGLTAEVIHDAGRTQIASGSMTVLGIGPGPKSLIDRVTGHLSLL